MSEVDFQLVIRGRVAWGQMHMCLRINQLLPLFHCVGMCECMRARVTVKGVRWRCWGGNKHIFRCLSYASTQVRPGACWGVRLCQMATPTQTQQCPALGSNCSPPVVEGGQTHVTGLQTSPCLSPNLAKNSPEAVWCFWHERLNHVVTWAEGVSPPGPENEYVSVRVTLEIRAWFTLDPLSNPLRRNWDSENWEETQPSAVESCLSILPFTHNSNCQTLY